MNHTHLIEKTEKGVLWVLAYLLLAAVLLGIVDLVVNFVQVLCLPPILMIKPDTLFHMFGQFLIVLMGLKLIKLVLLSMPGEDSPMTAVIEVALIGIGQKVVTMDVKTQPASISLGVAALVLALSVAYAACWHVQKSWIKEKSPGNGDEAPTAASEFVEAKTVDPPS